MASRVLQNPTSKVLVFGSAIFIVVAGLRFTADLVAPILLAYTCVIALLPLVKRLENRGLPRPLALASVFLTAFLVAALIIAFFLFDVQQFAGRLPTYQATLETRIDNAAGLGERLGFKLSDLMSLGHMVPANLTHATLGLISRLLNATASLILFLLILLTMSLEFPAVSHAFYSHLRNQSVVYGQVRSLLTEIQTHFRLQTLSNLISAVAVTAAYLVFRVDFALLWGLLTFFLSYIPRIGMLLSFLPPVFMAFVQFGLQRALVLFLIAFVLNALMDNLVTPMLSKKGLALRSTTIIITSLAWMWVLGPLGALLAMPMTLAIRKLLESSDQTLPLAYAISTDDYHPGPSQVEAP